MCSMCLPVVCMVLVPVLLLLKFSRLRISLIVFSITIGKTINFADVQDDFRTEYDHLKNEPVELVASPYFTTSLYDMTEEITCDYSELDSFVIFICVEGACRITDDSQNEIAVRAGETILLPAITQEVTIVPEDGGVKLLETYL